MATRPLTPGVVETDIARILEAKSLHPNAITYEVIVHTVDEDIPVTELISVEVSRDYANNVCDYIVTTFTMGLGQYIKRVHPFLDNLEMSIITKYYGRSYVDRYKLLILTGPDNIAGSMYTSYTEEELDQTDKVILETQCLNRLVEVLRLQPTSGIYSYTNVRDVIKTTISNAVADVAVANTKPDIGFNCVEPDNSKTYRHINVPVGVRVLELPTFLQVTDYGVYSADIGTYIQRYGYFEDNVEPKDTVFIYPLYTPDLVDAPGKRLMILSSPTTILSQVESSYVIDGDVVKIIGSGDMRSNDISQTKLINSGNSVITADTGSIMHTGSVATDSEVNTKNSINLTGESLVNKRDGFNGQNYTRPTSNPYKEYTEISKNMLSPYQVTWNYSNPELIFPGMPVIYVYEDIDKGVIRLNGIVHSLFNKYNASYKTHTTVLNVLLESYVDGMDKGVDVVDVSR